MRHKKFLHSKVWHLDNIKASLRTTKDKLITFHMVKLGLWLIYLAWEMCQFQSNLRKMYQLQRVTFNSRLLRTQPIRQPLITAGIKPKVPTSSNLGRQIKRWEETKHSISTKTVLFNTKIHIRNIRFKIPRGRGYTHFQLIVIMRTIISLIAMISLLITTGMM